MNHQETYFGYFSILLSFGIGILCIRKIRSYDVHEREPVLDLCLAAVYGGLISVAVSLAGYTVVYFFLPRGSSHWYWYLLLVAPLEEASKYLGFLGAGWVYRKNLNEPLDGMVYMAAVALGFSLTENFLYANSGNSSEHLLFIRVLLSTPAHILASLPIGLAGYLSFQGKLGRKGVLAALALAGVIHGLYDIFCGHLFLLVVLYLCGLWIEATAVFRYLNVRSPFRVPLRVFMERSTPEPAVAVACLACGNAEGNTISRTEGIAIGTCSACGVHLVSRDDAFLIFHRLAPEFRNLQKEYFPSKSKPGLYELYECIYVDDVARTGFFRFEEVEARIATITERIRRDSQGRWLSGKLARLLGPEDLQTVAWRVPAAKLPKVGLLFLGIVVSAAVGTVYIRYLEMPLAELGRNAKFEGRHFRITRSRGWIEESDHSNRDSVETLNFTLKNRAALLVKFHCWQILPREKVQAVLKAFETGMNYRETARDTFTQWGRYHGYGLRLEMEKDEVGIRYGVFAYTDSVRSFFVQEVSESRERKAEIRFAKMRNSFELTSDCREPREVMTLDSSETKQVEKILGIKHPAVPAVPTK